MTLPALITLATAAALVAACGGDDEANGGGSASAGNATKAETSVKAVQPDGAVSARKGTTVKVINSRFGRVLADRRGEAFYLFDKEKTKRSECYGACARAWPPLLTRSKPRAGKGARGSLLGTTRRRGGKLQVTYRGRPLYYYKDDDPGRILCHKVAEFGGLWLVVRPNGTPAG